MSEEPTSEELDGVRIRRLAAERRAAYRARSHSIIAAIACIVLALQLGWVSFNRIRAGTFTRSVIAYIIIALIAIIAATALLRRARRLHKEAARSVLPEPSNPPDFSTLSDGSQRWKNLENIE